MIRINLLRRRKVRRAAKGTQSLFLGMLIIILAVAGVYFGVQKPAEREIATKQRLLAHLRSENADIEKKTQNFATVKAKLKIAQKRKAAIARLNNARATPAWLLHELSQILTPGKQPTMSAADAAAVAQDSNRSWMDGWDPKHVWIIGFAEKNGAFTLKGGAQSDSDMTQLALRMQASAYFYDVIPKGGGEKDDSDSGVSYYEFTITGKVRY